MKKLSAIAAFSAILLVCASCEKTPGSKDPGPLELSPKSSSGVYLGDIFSSGAAQWDLTFYVGEVDMFGDITGDGYKLYLEIYAGEASDPSAAILPPGDYTAGSTPLAGKFAAGYLNENTGMILSSKLTSFRQDGGRDIRAVTEGKFTVSGDASAAVFSAELTLSDGQTVICDYSGPLSFVNIGDVEDNNTFSYCEGNYYGDRKGKGSEEYLLDVYELMMTDDFKMYYAGLYLDGFMKTGTGIADTPAPGRYEISDVCGPLTFLPGDITADVLSGSYYYETGTDMMTHVKTVLIKKGYYVVSLHEGNYTILTNFTGVDSQSGDIVDDIIYKFTGTIALSDLSGK